MNEVSVIQGPQTSEEPKADAAGHVTEMSSPGAPVWEVSGSTAIRPHELESTSVAMEVGDRDMHEIRAELPER